MSIDGILAAQAAWDQKTFGPGLRSKGTVKHIRKELREILRKPEDEVECCDVAILALGAAMRIVYARLVGFGFAPQDARRFAARDVARVYEKKMLENLFDREWPPPGAEDEPVEHVRRATKKVRACHKKRARVTT